MTDTKIRPTSIQWDVYRLLYVHPKSFVVESASPHVRPNGDLEMEFSIFAPSVFGTDADDDMQCDVIIVIPYSEDASPTATYNGDLPANDVMENALRGWQMLAQAQRVVVSVKHEYFDRVSVHS